MTQDLEMDTFQEIGDLTVIGDAVDRGTLVDPDEFLVTVEIALVTEDLECPPITIEADTQEVLIIEEL